MKVANFAHFFKEKRSVLDINGELPKIEKGFPKDGNIMVSISNEKGERKAFKLSMLEVCRLVFALQSFISRHEEELAMLGERKSFSKPDNVQNVSDKKESGKDPLDDILL